MKSFDPLARRMYLLHALADAQNECEIVAAQVALNVLEREYPDLKTVSYMERSNNDNHP